MSRRMVRTDATKKAQATYERDKLAAGEHVQIGLKLKTAEDVAMIEDLRSAHPSLSDAGIQATALSKLARQVVERSH